MAATDSPSLERRGIGDLFYETRVLKGRDWTLARFAREVLGEAVDPVMLGYIEKGARFPNEGLVRRLANDRGEDPRRLLAILARDRMVKSIGKELRKVLEAPGPVVDVADAEMAARVTMAIAALPDNGSFTSKKRWRAAYSAPLRRGKGALALGTTESDRVLEILVEQDLIVIKGDKVSRSGRHYQPVATEERTALALEYSVLFLKSVLDRLVFPDEDSGTYVRNHYLNIERSKVPEFRDRLDEALRGLAEEYAAEASEETEFFNVLATATFL
ncbi:MAG: hypothetical protein ACI8TX_002840 [Hyphomicrobiaceae bacterium]